MASRKKVKGSAAKGADTNTDIPSISYYLRKYRPMRFHLHKMQVVTSIEEDDDIKVLKHADYFLYSLKYIKPKVVIEIDRKRRTVETAGTLRNIPISPAFMDYTFNLSRLANRFLWYLLTYEVDYLTNQVKFNKQTKYNWKEYCNVRELTKDEEFYSERSLQNTMTELKDNHIVINISKSVYMLNPIVVCKGGFYEQNKMVNEYAEAIIRNGKEVSLLIMPKTSLSI
jgi:hypothetical protein